MINMKTLVLVVTGTMSVLLTENCQMYQMMQCAWWKQRKKTWWRKGSNLWLLYLLLYVLIHLPVWCHNSLQLCLLAIHTRALSILSWKEFQQLTKAIRKLDGAMAFMLPLNSSYFSWQMNSWLMYPNGIQLQQYSFPCPSACTVFPGPQDAPWFFR